MQVRLQKVLSRAGIASRRAAERLIAEGRVTVNGVAVREMGTKADPAADDVRVDGRRVKGPERLRYILLNKPAGYVTTRSDPQRRPTVIELLRGVREYVYPVGRLDYDTEGLLLLTNDGDLAARLTHPRHGVERTYDARVAGVPGERDLERLRSGIPLDGRRTLPADVDMIGRVRSGPGSASAHRAPDEKAARHDRESVLRITIREGRTRQVRRMCDAIGHPVLALRRVRIGPLSDRRLKRGEWRELTEQEIRALQRKCKVQTAK
jgi:pseudouridine synthase